MLDVICVGSVTFDTIAVVARIPGDDERVLSETVVSAGGGPAATAAVALARLGARVGFCGVVGDDAAGASVRAELEAEGVVTDWLVTSSEVATAQSVVLVSSETAGRTIVTTRAPAPATVPIDQSEWLHVDQTGFAPARAALSRWTGAGQRPRLSVDAGNPIESNNLSGIDLFVPSVPALRLRYPSVTSDDLALDAALAQGASAVIATDGSRGTLVRYGGHTHFVDAFSVPVVSTLGAGDVFHGALLASVVAGRELAEAVREANAVAALSCRVLDGRSGIPRARELHDFLASVGSEAFAHSSTSQKVSL